MNKGKIFNISLNIAHFSKKISYIASYLLVQYTVNLMVFLYLALNMEKKFRKCGLLEKFILSFFFEQDHLRISYGTVPITIWPIFSEFLIFCRLISQAFRRAK